MKIKDKFKKFFIALLLLPFLVSAHQPRIVDSRFIKIHEPEISKAYYAKLSGEPDVYLIKSDKPFDLYVNILVPDILGQKKDVSAIINRLSKNGDSLEKIKLAFLDGKNFNWKLIYEDFGADNYFMGPEYQSRVEAGSYEIQVWSDNNDSKYALVVGEKEYFNLKEIINAFTLIPKIKNDFFNKSPITFIVSPFAWGAIFIIFFFAFIFGLIFRFILKLLAKNSLRGLSRNISKKDRLFRLFIGLALFFWAILTSWNPIIIFFSGFTIFEAIFSWCGFYALIGKNTCKIN
ncbi:MAG: YgaP family membrane protein [Minisyncoccia bacterium]